MLKLTSLALVSAFMGLGFQAAPSTSLEERVKHEMNLTSDDADLPSLKERLLKLGTPQDLISLLLGFTAKYREAKPGGFDYNYLTNAVFQLGKFRERRAVPPLVEIARDRSARLDLRTLAIQSIGEIDPIGNRELLVGTLREDSSLRSRAAEALASTDDPMAMREIEIVASRESSHDAFLRLQALADSMRARINAKSK